MKQFFIAIISLLILSTPATGITLFRVDKDISGKVIDVDTGKPIQGVVVSAVWGKEVYTIAGTNSEYYDAYETLTNQKGEFTIPGKGVVVFSRMKPPSLRIFKATYEDLGLRDILGKEFNKNSFYKDRVRWEPNTAVISIKKLTMEERKKRHLPAPPRDAPLKKVRLLLKEIDKDETEQGLRPRNIWRGEKYD